MHTIKQIKYLRRKNCIIRVAEDTSLEKGFWSEIRTLDGNTLYQSTYQYTVDDALALAEGNAPILTRTIKVKPKSRRYSKAAVIAYARKMNTPANARKMAWVDNGHYTVSKPLTSSMKSV